jgi:hypothetical protein
MVGVTAAVDKRGEGSVCRTSGGPPSRNKDGIMDNWAELLTVADICRTLGVSRAWVIEHSNGRRRPVLPSIKLGKVRRFDPLDLKSFIDDCRRIGQTRVQNGGAKVQR